jgi:hypothetical protein
LREKANSFFWVRDGKDSLALGNISGAMVFQSTLPVSIGLAFTVWELDSYSVLAGCLALAGGFVAILTIQIRRRFSVSGDPLVGDALRRLRGLRRSDRVRVTTLRPCGPFTMTKSPMGSVRECRDEVWATCQRTKK